MAMDLYLIRLDGTYARYTGVVADPVLLDMTGKGEPYRDIPGIVLADVGYTDVLGHAQATTNTGLTFTNPVFTDPPAGATYPPYLSGTLGIVESDDVAHVAPRQAVQTYTFWKFTFATVALTPTYAYAEFRRGDIISNTAPNTDPTP